MVELWSAFFTYNIFYEASYCPLFIRCCYNAIVALLGSLFEKNNAHNIGLIIRLKIVIMGIISGVGSKGHWKKGHDPKGHC